MKESDADPIAEAEVYIAYGRPAQARVILEEAMRCDPTRDDIRRTLAQLGPLPASGTVALGPLGVVTKIIVPLVAPALLWVPGLLLMAGVFPVGPNVRYAGFVSFVLGMSGIYRAWKRLVREGRIVQR